MPARDQQRVAIRVFNGVNLMINARVVAPGSWRRLQNLYMPSPGRLSQAPGTVQHAQKVVVGEPSPTPSGWAGNYPGGASGYSRPLDGNGYNPENTLNPVGYFTEASVPRTPIAPVGTVAPTGRVYVAPTAGTVLYELDF